MLHGAAVALLALALTASPAHARSLDVLLVDDARGIVDAAAPYREALDSLGVSHRTWLVRERKEPEFSDLAEARAVIWLNGTNRSTPGPNPGRGDETVRAWLHEGGRLLLSSDSMPFSRASAALLEGYFGVTGATQLDRRLDTLIGVGDFDGSGPDVLACPPRIGNAPIGLRVGGAKPVLRWRDGGAVAGVLRETNAYVTVYLATPFECLRDRGARGALLARVLQRFGVDIDRSERRDDSFEPNDDPSQATPAPIGLPGIEISQTHVLDAAGDVEWLRFVADPRAPVTFTVRRDKGADPVAVELLDAQLEVRQREVLPDKPGSEVRLSGDGLGGESYLRLRVADVQASRIGDGGERENVVTVSGAKQAVYSAYVVGHVVAAEDGTGLPNADVFLEFANRRVTACAPPTLSSIAPGNVGFFELGCNIDLDAMLKATKNGYFPGEIEVTLVPSPSLADDAVSVELAAAVDTDGDGTPDIRDEDDDGDGMPDVYEEQFDELDPVRPDADADPDGDGFSNLEEYRDQTDPGDPKSNHGVRMRAVAGILNLLLDD